MPLSGEIIFLDEIHDYFSSNQSQEKSTSTSVAELNSFPIVNSCIDDSAKSCSDGNDMNNTSGNSDYCNMVHDDISAKSDKNEYENHNWKSEMKYVRVTGHLTYIDLAKRYCEISNGGYSLHIDMSICDDSAIRLDNLCQFIGELRERKQDHISTATSSESQLYLQASVSRVVDDLDMALYRETIIMRRKFINSLKER